MSEQESLENKGSEQKQLDLFDELPRHPTKKHKLRRLGKIKKIVLHATDWETTPQKLAAYDVSAPNHISDTGCPAITYSEIYMRDGTAYKTLPLEEIAWHAGNHNPSSVGVAMMYKVRNRNGVDTYTPTRKQMAAAQESVANLCMELNISPKKVFGHRELWGTGWSWKEGSKVLRKTCPGKKVDMNKFREIVARIVQTKLIESGHYAGKVDGIFGKISKKALRAYHASIS